MNKEKVMQAVYELSDLQSICSKSMRQKAINKVKSEIYSKAVMPKVFDEWFKYVIKSYGGPDTRKALSIAFNTLLTVQSNSYDKSESDLKNWLVQSDSIEDLDRISRCIDAITNGYEVEK